MVPPGSDRVSPAPPYSGSSYGRTRLRVRGFHALRPGFPKWFPWHVLPDVAVLQPRSRLDAPGLGFSAFARRYSRNRFCFPFLRVLRCFNSPGNGPCAIAHGRRPVSGTAGSPIRTPPDRWMLGSSPGRFAARRVLPPGACQGIRRTLFFACSLENCSAVRGPPPASESSSTFRKALLSFLCVVRFSGYPARRRLSRTPGRRKGQHCVFS